MTVRVRVVAMYGIMVIILGRKCWSYTYNIISIIII